MKKEGLFDKIFDLKEKFKSFFQHRKKVSALENYSFNSNFKHRSYLNLVKTCMKEGFLDDEESGFLDHMLNKYEMNYLDWAHKTRWVKNKIREAALLQRKQIQSQVFFDFEKKAHACACAC